MMTAAVADDYLTKESEEFVSFCRKTFGSHGLKEN
jgi:hypothetical protein